MLLAQYWVTHQVNEVVDEGDSGSPVFRIAASGNRVELYGILWGMMQGNHKSFVFSPIGNAISQQSGIQTELGALDYIY
jgi:hypothetical protein